jgi:hypothetical protein
MFHVIRRSRAELLFLIIRKQEDLSRQLRECQNLLGDLEPFVSGHIAKRVKVVLVSDFHLIETME